MNLKSPGARYTIGMTIWMVLYAAALFGSITLIQSQAPTGPLLYILAVLPALPIGGTILTFLAYIERVDEYLRANLVKRFIIATGLTLFLCTAWGFLENNAGAHQFSLYLVYPLFWGLFGATNLILRKAS